MERHAISNVNTERISSLYRVYAEQIYRYCFFRVFRKDIAEEFMQETFLRLWRHMESGHPVRNERALLYTIATNLIIDEKRKRREESLDKLLADRAIDEPSEDGAMENVVNHAALREIWDEIALFSEDEQELITMRYVSDLEPKEIAEALGVSANAVSVRLSRLVNKLKDKREKQ